MDTPNEKTNAFEIIKNYAPVILAVGALFVNVVLTWKNVADNQVQIKELNDKMTRQYQVQREMNDKTNAEVEKVLDYIEFEKGYQQAQKDLKK
jgi:hypothetical protein